MFKEETSSTGMFKEEISSTRVSLNPTKGLWESWTLCYPYLSELPCQLAYLLFDLLIIEGTHCSICNRQTSGVQTKKKKRRRRKKNGHTLNFFFWHSFAFFVSWLWLENSLERKWRTFSGLWKVAIGREREKITFTLTATSILYQK